MKPLSGVIRLIEKRTGIDCTAANVSSVQGGDINQAWCLQQGDQRFFVKTNRADRQAMFEAEQFGLQAIRETQSIRVPDVIGCGIDGDTAFIVMEFLKLGRTADEKRLAEQLANMHHHTGPAFGFTIDNTIGSSTQNNSFNDNWIEFWRKYRLGYQLELADKNGLSQDIIVRGQRLNDKLAQFFDNYQPRPSLLHGDLWSGNQGADSDGNPVIFDPACYYGDHEADLAMMELFGAPSRTFFDVYHAHFAIDEGYKVRRDLYNLYHMLNHANLFGGGYAASAGAIIDRLLAQA